MSLLISSFHWISYLFAVTHHLSIVLHLCSLSISFCLLNSTIIQLLKEFLLNSYFQVVIPIFKNLQYIISYQTKFKLRGLIQIYNFLLSNNTKISTLVSMSNFISITLNWAFSNLQVLLSFWSGSFLSVLCILENLATSLASTTKCQ